MMRSTVILGLVVATLFGFSGQASAQTSIERGVGPYTLNTKRGESRFGCCDAKAT